MPLNISELQTLNVQLFPTQGEGIKAAEERQYNNELVLSLLNTVEQTQQSLSSNLNMNGKLLLNANNAVERQAILEGSSFNQQDPTGLGVNLQVEFGPSIGDGSDAVQLLANGSIQINQTSYLEFIVDLAFGRIGGGGTSELVLRGTLNGTQAGSTQTVFLDDGNIRDSRQYEASGLFPAGTTLNVSFQRDINGNDSGGLYPYAPSDSANYGPVPSARLRVFQYYLSNDLKVNVV